METTLQDTELRRQISELADREAIRQLPILYCHYVRTRNVDSLVRLYSEDGLFESRKDADPPDVYKGRAEIEESLRKRLDAMDPWPFTHNHVVQFSEEGNAHGFVYAEIRMGSCGHRLVYLAVYEDDYVKENGSWKFGSRKLSLTTVGTEDRPGADRQ